MIKGKEGGGIYGSTGEGAEAWARQECEKIFGATLKKFPRNPFRENNVFPRGNSLFESELSRKIDIDKYKYMVYNGMERGDFMSKYTGYTQGQNKATQKYIKEKRDCLNLNLPKGTKDKWKEQAEQKGYKSLTAYITELIEGDR